MTNVIKKNDFIELKYTGISDGKVFDSNVEEDLKKANSELKAKEMILIVGYGILIPGLEKEIEGKEVGKEYSVKLNAKNGFGERNKNLIKVIPLRVFTEKEIMPRAGMVLNMDYSFAKVIAVSGARVTMDFNHPMAGKDLEYKFKIVRKVEDEKEKCNTVFQLFLRTIPEYEIKDKVIVKASKDSEAFIDVIKVKFKELIGKDLVFEEKKVDKKEEKVEKKQI
jgi:FKBP-type peptidyl-prolyl cis-trans isomerase 2